jgi:general secretion pathway protein K
VNARQYPRRYRQRGVALITAMMIFAIVAIVAADLAWDNALDVRRTRMLLMRDQAVQVALGAESWVATILAQDLSESETDHLGEIWASDLPPLPIDGGDVFGVIEDLQGRFNVNNLVTADGEPDEEALEQFRRLLVSLELDPRIAGLVADWLDPNLDAAFPDGAEDPIYTGFNPPYRTANQLISSVGELAAIEGIDKLTFDTLAPHLAALPGRTTINVNTATPFVLQSLDEGMSAGDVEGLIGEREQAGFADVPGAFSSLVTPEVLNTLGETSNYFQLRVTVRIDTVRLTLYSVMQRGPQGSVTPILRSIGTT